MKPEEIRIGNWVNYRGIHQCIIDENDFAQLYYDDDYFELLKPIELTEEWLEKLGFNQFPGESRLYDADNFWAGKLIDRCFYIKDLEVAIYYVHQLQNLYYALTGKELQLK